MPLRTMTQNAAALDLPLEQVFLKLSSTQDLAGTIGRGLRKAFDEVIDGPRTGRYRIEQLEKTEKTYIGTKVEILLRTELMLERGNILDNLICGHEVDTKFTTRDNWMIPREAIGELCLLVEANDNTGLFSVGLLRMNPDVLNNGQNQDGKKSVSSFGKPHIRWLLRQARMPLNFLLHLDDQTRIRIMSHDSGLQRVAELFRSVTGKIIPRTAIEQVAQQQDPMRRARQMKEKLAEENIEVLCATYLEDRMKFAEYGFPYPKNDDWLSIRHL